jgi:uncharacterized membrane protein YfcA
VSYPVLLAVGLSPLSANVTNTVAMVWVGVGAAAGSGAELDGQARRVARLAAAAVTGGAVGGGLLLATPPGTFEVLVPVLIAAAALVLLLPGRVRGLLGGTVDERGPRLFGVVFGIAVYTGYFGAAGGVAMLAVLTVAIAEPLPRVNAVKNVVSSMASLVAAVAFALAGPVDWAAAAPLAAGVCAGSVLGPRVVRRSPPAVLRGVIALATLGLALALALRTYR